jgi:hypothetical protein
VTTRWFNKSFRTIRNIDGTAYGALRPVRNCALGKDDDLLWSGAARHIPSRHRV